MVQQIQDKYGTLFAMTRVSGKILEEEWQIELSDGDIAYLTIHLGGAIRRSGTRKAQTQIVYLICDEGCQSNAYFINNASITCQIRRLAPSLPLNNSRVSKTY